MIASLKITSWRRNPENPEDYKGGLVEMPDGSWMDPALITRVVPLDGMMSSLGGAGYLPRCVIHFGESDRAVVECSDMEGAKNTARWFAMLANRARTITQGDT